MEGIAIVRSSNGNIYIDFETGAVKHIDRFPEGELPEITKFELPEEKAAEYDILELDFWTIDGILVKNDSEFFNRRRLEDKEIENLGLLEKDCLNLKGA